MKKKVRHWTSISMMEKKEKQQYPWTLKRCNGQNTCNMCKAKTNPLSKAMEITTVVFGKLSFIYCCQWFSFLSSCF